MSNHEASATVWQWRERQAAGSDRAARHSRRKAVVRTGLMLAAALAVAFLFHRPWVGAVIASVGLLAFGAGLAAPAFEAWMARSERVLARAVAGTTTWILLAPLYCLCFAPARLVLKWRGADPMTRGLRRDAATYWTDHGPVADKARYSRQF